MGVVPVVVIAATPTAPISAPTGERVAQRRPDPRPAARQDRRPVPGAGVTVVGVSEQQPDAGTPTSDPDSSDPRRPPGPARQVHRSPRYGAFLVTGAVIGVAVAVLSGLLGTGDGSIGTGQLIGYLAMIFGLLGALLGGAAAVVIERFSRPPGR
jgi:hypothetical protein